MLVLGEKGEEGGFILSGEADERSGCFSGQPSERRRL